ncbi:hypothetical protein, partial [Klebsiella quasipneumoniae]|uniref:hypothetical protein n=1 Tax=Klebsiella quasipneumoniae TaxID=1463165 RepID=UPI001C52788C
HRKPAGVAARRDGATDGHRQGARVQRLISEQAPPDIGGAARKANQLADLADSIRATDLVAMEW